MSLDLPKLDDRNFQDLVDEARRLIPRYCPQWTDHNLSDPGITLIELFATLVDTMIYRLNRVPEKSYITFMNLMGVQLEPPTAARAPLTFWLSVPLSVSSAEPVLIPSGTEVAIDQSGTMKEAISFSTNTDLLVRPPNLIACLTSSDDITFGDESACLQNNNDEEPFAVFQKTPQPGDSFCVVDKNDLSGHILALTLTGPIQGYGIKPDDAPLRWEGWCGEIGKWRLAEQESDGTSGLNQEGQVILHLPQGMVRRETSIGGKKISGYWVRCVLLQHRDDQKTYSASPKISAIQAETLGGTIEATHATTINGEILGRSDGTPGQTFHLEYTPVLPLNDGERIEVQNGDGNWIAWKEPANKTFSRSTDKDLDFILDSVSGEISFGPIIRERDGRERQYGAIPPLGDQIRFTHYRSGGGSIGNVGAKTLKVLKSSLPYIKEVTNRKTAVGGLDAETLERAKLRAPQMLRTSSRAVTAEDFEYLAIEAKQGVKRAKCISPTRVKESNDPLPGVIRLLLVPAIEPADGPIGAEQLTLVERKAMVEGVRKYIDERRLLTTIVRIEAPKYIEVSVIARVKKRAEADTITVRNDAQARLYKFLNPLAGGSNERGWPFGRPLYISEVYAQLQSTSGVEYVLQVDLHISGQQGPQERIEVASDSLIVSGAHVIGVE